MDRQQRAEVARRLIARFRQLKADEGWTQSTLEQESGVPNRTVSDTLRGVSIPNPETLEKLAQAMGLELTPEQVRETWPVDIDVFLDVLGLYLAKHTPEQRRVIMRDISDRHIGPAV